MAHRPDMPPPTESPHTHYAQGTSSTVNGRLVDEDKYKRLKKKYYDIEARWKDIQADLTRATEQNLRLKSEKGALLDRILELEQDSPDASGNSGAFPSLYSQGEHGHANPYRKSSNRDGPMPTRPNSGPIPSILTSQHPIPEDFMTGLQRGPNDMDDDIHMRLHTAALERRPSKRPKLDTLGHRSEPSIRSPSSPTDSRRKGSRAPPVAGSMSGSGSASPFSETVLLSGSGNNGEPPHMLEPLSPQVKRDKYGSPILPLHLGGDVVIHRMGQITPLPGFHDERYIYPLEYEIHRPFISLKNPSVQTTYRCRILDQPSSKDAVPGPIFELTPMDQPNTPFASINPNSLWSELVAAINDKIRLEAMAREKETGISSPPRLLNDVNGMEMFGLNLPIVRGLIQDLPYARDCKEYIWQDPAATPRGNNYYRERNSPRQRREYADPSTHSPRRHHRRSEGSHRQKAPPPPQSYSAPPYPPSSRYPSHPPPALRDPHIRDAPPPVHWVTAAESPSRRDKHRLNRSEDRSARDHKRALPDMESYVPPPPPPGFGDHPSQRDPPSPHQARGSVPPLTPSHYHSRSGAPESPPHHHHHHHHHHHRHPSYPTGPPPQQLYAMSR